MIMEYTEIVCSEHLVGYNGGHYLVPIPTPFLFIFVVQFHLLFEVKRQASKGL